MTDTTFKNRLGRRSFAGGLLVAPAILSHAGRALAADPQPLRIMVQNPIIQTDYLHLLCDRTGIFTAHGIKSSFTSSTSPILPLLTGEVDIVSIGSANGLVAVAKKQDFQFVAAAVPRATLALMVRADSPLVKVAHRWPDVFQALKGKIVGVTVAGALIDFIGRYLSLLAGLTPDKDITIQAAGNASVLVGELSKAVYDAALVPSPLFELMEGRKEAVSVLDFYKGEGPPELANVPFAAPAARMTFTDKNPDLINRYIASLQEASDMARNSANRAKVTTIIAEELKADPASLGPAMDTFVAAIGSVKFSREQWNTTNAMMKAIGIVTENYDYEKYVFAGARA